MLSKSLIAILYATSVARAAPVVKRDAYAYENVISANNEVSFLAVEYVNQEGPIAREVLTSAYGYMNDLASQILEPSTYVCPLASYTNISTLAEAMNDLNYTQTNLGYVLANIVNPGSAPYTTNDAFCNANNTLSELHDYTYNVGEGASNVTLDIATTYTDVGLQYLASALDVIYSSDRSSHSSQIAYNNTQSGYEAFVQASGYAGEYTCGEETVPAAGNATQAAEYTEYILQVALPETYDALVAHSAHAQDLLCEVDAYFSAINEYVMA